jgi:hypothetical protein
MADAAGKAPGAEGEGVPSVRAAKAAAAAAANKSKDGPTSSEKQARCIIMSLVGLLAAAGVTSLLLAAFPDEAAKVALTDKAALGRLLDELGDERLGNRRPALVRGDSGYGNEGILLTLEERKQPYLLRLRQTKNVQRLVAQQFARQDWSRPDSQGCQMVEAQLQLHGWSTKRRVVIVRQRIRGGIARERRVDGKQLRLDLAGPSVHEGDKLWEYAVLVTDVAYPLESIGQLYRDRADAENAFDELKNQWGLGGFTTQDINRCQTVARACALVYNWWSWYCRAAHPTGRLEAITSRPLLLAAVGKAASHANQTTLYLTPLHGRADVLRRLIANIGTALQHVKAAAEQFKDLDRWGYLLRYISDRIAPVLSPPKPAQGLPATG